MRKIVVTEFVSLDGVIEDPGGAEGFQHGGWTMPYWSDELGAFKTAELVAADAHLLGRTTYEAFAAAWPSRTGDEFSDRMNSYKKYVVSSTLTSADWKNSTVIGFDDIKGLREQPGADILVAGSATLVKGLLDADLVDELRLAVYPLMLGTGKRLAPTDLTKFVLAEHTATANGVLLLVYRKETR